MESANDIAIQDISHFLGNNPQSGEVGQYDSSPSTRRHEFSLPRADGGKDAWLFLAACFIVEALVWGEFALSLLEYMRDSTMRCEESKGHPQCAGLLIANLLWKMLKLIRVSILLRSLPRVLYQP